MPSDCFMLAVMAERRKLGRQPRPTERYVSYRGLRMLELSRAKRNQEANNAGHQSHTSPAAGELLFGRQNIPVDDGDGPLSRDTTRKQLENVPVDEGTLDTTEQQMDNLPVDDTTKQQLENLPVYGGTLDATEQQMENLPVDDTTEHQLENLPVYGGTLDTTEQQTENLPVDDTTEHQLENLPVYGGTLDTTE